MIPEMHETLGEFIARALPTVLEELKGIYLLLQKEHNQVDEKALQKELEELRQKILG